MMVPSMQGTLLGVIAERDPQLHRVLDPFVGSGTTLVETMRRGLDFHGSDVNPLAVLLARVRMGPFHVRRLRTSAQEVQSAIALDRRRKIGAQFPGIDKWFTPRAQTELSRIRRAVRTVDNLWCRRVMWLALTETVRLTSNARTSTVKLHIREAKELKNRDPSPHAVFGKVLEKVVSRLQTEASDLRTSGRLQPSGSYRGSIRVRLGDASEKRLYGSEESYDLLITSPPYGDNVSTVSYGQFSYLPLQWIDLTDITSKADESFLSSTHEIDRRSLGGSRRNALRDVSPVAQKAPSLQRTLVALADEPIDRAGRVAGFFRDFGLCLDPILKSLRADAYLVFTVGNRHVGGREVPFDEVLRELMADHGAVSVAEVRRAIRGKRMAAVNNVSSTMLAEKILVFRKL